MFVRITTTVTTDIDLETYTPKHSVEIEAEDGLPPDFTASAVYGACRATMHTLNEKYPHLHLADVSDDDDENDEKDKA